MSNKPAKTFVRRDRLLQIEEEIQNFWKDKNYFEEDHTCGKGREKFFINFPYPYMNGKLHLGHAFSLTKTEFQARFQRLQGKHVLFPFAFHCTGMPIVASARNLSQEFESEKFEEIEKVEKVEKVEKKKEEKEVEKNFKSKKTKLVMKSDRKTQYEILRSLGIPEEDIKKFRDPNHWLEYFPPLAKRHLQRFALSADWRRAFITTDRNPFYDQFVRWQFYMLRQKELVEFGKRETVFSLSTRQPVADHDRLEGEGVNPQQYTLVKMRVLNLPRTWEIEENSRVFLGCATLRPETMYGQTNCFVKPDGEYGIYETREGEFLVVSKHAAVNLFFQDKLKEDGMVSDKTSPEMKKQVSGRDLIGLRVEAPLTEYEYVYVLPMTSILMDKGTGIVTSVPADSPDDYVNLRELQENEKLRESYGVSFEMVDFPIIPIIEIEVPEFDSEGKQIGMTKPYGKCAAESVCLRMKIKSPKDKDKLAEAKQEVYTKGFYGGRLIVGEFKGHLVKDSKNLVRDLLLNSKEGILYFEPEKKVIARTGDLCICATCDQWYSSFAKKEWKDKVREHVKKMKFFNSQTEHAFLATVEWLQNWACSRTLGLGTRLPWDEKWIIESLSDSTVYFAYQTLAHVLEGGRFIFEKENPTREGLMKCEPEYFTPDVFNYIFGITEKPPQTLLKEEDLEYLKNEFSYWYPLDCRCSGKDLIQNHLTMSLFHHEGLWNDKAPRSVYCNGMILVNGEKMSKAKGTFITLEDGCQDYGADVLRFTLADSGDSLDDSNFCTTTADNTISRFTNLLTWIDDVLPFTEEKSELDLVDSMFENELNSIVDEARHYYSKMQFREALRVGFYEMENLRSEYEQLKHRSTKGVRHWNSELLDRFLSVQAVILFPICPHFCEYLWRRILKRNTSINEEFWPKLSREICPTTSRQFHVLRHGMRQFRVEKQKLANSILKQKQKKKEVLELERYTSAVIYVAEEYHESQRKILRIMQKRRSETDEVTSEDLIEAVKKELENEPKDEVKIHLRFASFIANDEAKARGLESALQLQLPFNERDLFQSQIELISNQLSLDVSVRSSKDPHDTDVEKAKLAQPGRPQISFFAS